MVHYNSIAQLVDLEYRLSAIESPEPERVLELFKRLNAATGRAIYVWRYKTGLFRIGAEQIYIPRTGQPLDVLTYIAASKHYGAYVMLDFAEFLEQDNLVKRMQSMIDPKNPVHRLLVMLGSYVQLPEGLAEQAVRIRHSMTKRA